MLPVNGNPWSVSMIGLYVFIAYVFVAVIVLVVDAGLMLAHQPTITDYVRDEVEDNKWVGWLLVLLTLLGPLGLAVHFFGPD